MLRIKIIKNMQPLREAISENHTKAERMPFNVRMFKGQLGPDEYLLYLVQQLEIFKTIENIGIPSPLLSRVDAVQQDIDELENKGVEPQEILQSTKIYTTYLNSLNKETLLPHIYMHYLAIMYGGQMMKKAVPSSGKMYEFTDMKTAIASIRKVQKDEWADEVNKGFEYLIDIFNELETSKVA